MNFKNLLTGEALVQIEKKPAKQVAKAKERGCHFCPLNDDPNIHKLKGLKKIEQRSVMIWSGAPDRVANEDKEILGGRTGGFFFESLSHVGIERDQCDVQYTVRCWPTKREDGRRIDRLPEKTEVHCCSKYTEEAIQLNAGRARVHIVLGQEAAKALLRGEYRKKTPIFWSKKLKAHVVCVPHPTFFLKGAPQARYVSFMEQLRAAAHFLKHPGEFGILDAQQYKRLSKPKLVKKALEKLGDAAIRSKQRVAVDIESGWVKDGQAITSEEEKEGADEVLLCIGFSVKPGVAFTVVVDHPKNPRTEDERYAVKELLRKFLERKDLQRVFHHGSSDAPDLHKFIGIEPKYTFDTNYSVYLRWPNLKGYGLDNLTQLKLPEFAGYKSILTPYFPNKGFRNFALLPLHIICKYNSADADVTKRFEQMTLKVYKPLLRVYTSAAFTLARMQKLGPFYDRKFSDAVADLIPRKRNRLRKKLFRLAGKKFNPASPPQLTALIYGSRKQGGLGLPRLNEEKPNSTDKATLELLIAKTKHPFPTKLLEFRRLDRMDTTYLGKYKASASRYGWLRTNWWLTGTVTGRLSAGGKEEKDIVNFQNLHGEPVLKNLLVSDPKWRIACRIKDPAYHKRIKRLKVAVSLDYSGIEVRMLAEASGDKLLIEQFKSGINIHCAVGYELTGIDPAKIAKDDKVRRMIKALHFGIIYGKGKKTLYEDLISQGIKTTRSETDKLYDSYFRRYSGVARWIESQQVFAERNHYVETLFGFRRPIVTDNSDEGRLSFWGNQAVNSPLQGSAHQLLLIALALLHDRWEELTSLQNPIMEVHDALVFFTPVWQMRNTYRQALRLMEKEIPKYCEKYFDRRLKVPLVAESKCGFRLGSMIEYAGADPLVFVKDWYKNNKVVDAKINEEWGIAA